MKFAIFAETKKEVNMDKCYDSVWDNYNECLEKFRKEEFICEEDDEDYGCPLFNASDMEHAFRIGCEYGLAYRSQND